MNVKIKKLHKDAVVPKKAHENDFCFDLVAVTEEEIAPNVWKYGLGIAMQIERSVNSFDDLEGIDLSIDLRPRSSIHKTGMVLANSIGTGDEIFTGEYAVVFYHLMPNMPRYTIGDRVVQCKVGVAPKVSFKLVEELSETVRGDGGFGSSGK